MATYCLTCGALDSHISNGDNGGCQECYDTESIVWEDDYSEEEWEKIIEGKDA
jgi:hypothetical protein